MNVYDTVRFTDGSDIQGKVMEITRTSIKRANPDMTTVSDETVVKVKVMTFPDFKFVTVESHLLDIVDTTDKPANGRKPVKSGASV